MICHQYKCIFVHIPKNAGQSIEHVFLSNLGMSWELRAPLLLRENNLPELGPPSLSHLHAVDYVRKNYISEEIFDEFFKFSFVRNPWSRLVSMYTYLGYFRFYEFNYFVQKVVPKLLCSSKSWFVGPQAKYLYAEDGRCLMDFVGRFESLQVDFNTVCGHVGLEHINVPHVNKGKNTGGGIIKRIGKFSIEKITAGYIPRYDSYRAYYSQESIDKVACLYKDDVEKFRYDF
jgi:hypothetical protein